MYQARRCARATSWPELPTVQPALAGDLQPFPVYYSDVFHPIPIRNSAHIEYIKHHSVYPETSFQLNTQDAQVTENPLSQLADSQLAHRP